MWIFDVFDIILLKYQITFYKQVVRYLFKFFFVFATMCWKAAFNLM